MNHNTDYKIIRLNSSFADRNDDLTTLVNYDGEYDNRLTFYFKNPIILNEDYDLSIHSFTTNKIRTGNTINFPPETFGIATFYNYDTTQDELLPETINEEVIEETIENVRIWDYSTQSSTYYPRDAYITVKVVKLPNGDGYIYYEKTDTRGTGFVVGDFIHIDKQELVNRTGNNTFLNPSRRYAGFDVQTLNGDSEILDVSLAPNANNVILSYATGVQITEGIFYDIPLYVPDGAGYYNYGGVRCTASVVRTTGTNYGRVLITAITEGGTGFSLGDSVFLDKFSVVENVYPNTYSAQARFAEFNVTELVNGIGNLITPPNSITQEMLPNPTTLAFVDTNYDNVPFYKLVNGNYVESGATGFVTVLKNPDPDVNGRVTLQTITNAGTGFAIDDTLYIDKEYITQFDNSYNPAERYVSFQVQSLTSSSGGNVEIVNITNYGFTYIPLGLYYWEDPYSSIKITFEIYTPPGFSTQARIISVEGTGYDYSVGIYDIPNSQVVEQSTGTVGWGKQYGNLQIEITSNYPISYDEIVYKVALENVKYDFMKYKNSNQDGSAMILVSDVSKSTIDLYNQVLTLTPQIISELKVLVKQPILQGEQIDIALLLKKNSIYY